VLVGIGGSTREGSTSERIVRECLARARALGAETRLLAARELHLPLYAPERPDRGPETRALVEAIRGADGLVIVSPGYHGGVSGLIKNAIDYVEDLRDDRRPYLEGRAVGCVACASGWQAATTTLTALRSIIHALRGWPTPLGVAVNSALPTWTAHGALADAGLDAQLEILTVQVLGFARAQLAAAASP
jgi:FMN reductase